MKNLLKHILRARAREFALRPVLHPEVRYRGAQGFTLIETFVAITILMLAIAGPLSIASQGVSATRLSTDQMTALYLGQDAMETMRWAWQSGILQRVDAFTGPLSACQSDTGDAKCTVNTNYFDIAASDIAASCPGSPAVCPPLHINTEGQYTYSASDPVSPFTRSVSIRTCTAVGNPACANGTDERIVTVVVSWNTASGPHSITLRENLFYWQ